MENWNNIIEPLLTAVITLFGGYFLFTRTNIMSTNIIQSRIDWLQNIKSKFTDINNILTEILSKIEQQDIDSKENGKTPPLLNDEIIQAKKTMNDITQNFKPLKTKYNDEKREPEYENIEDSFEAQLESTLSDILASVTLYNQEGKITVDIPTFDNGKESFKQKSIYKANNVYNYFEYKIEELKEIQKAITKVEWEKIKTESFVRKKSKLNEQEVLKNNLKNISRQISEDFLLSEPLEDINNPPTKQSTVFGILSKAIEEAEEIGDLPNSMITPSKKRYIYTSEENNTHPSGKKLFNPKIYKGKDKKYKIETNYSKDYAYKYADIIKDHHRK